jgi:large subunit ribosomal protein L18
MKVKLLKQKLEKQVSKIMKKHNLKTRNRPRLHVFRSNKHIYAQVIDDKKHITITTSSSLCPKLRTIIESSCTCAAAEIVGKDIGQKLKEKGITQIVFDRGKRIYHGRIKALAEGTRQQGIQF